MIQTQTTQSTNGLLNENQVAACLGITVATLRKRRLLGRPPAYHKIGRSVRYSAADIEQFIASQRVDVRRFA
jgi:predicted DNA-binding transcriptional regulator AlpA